MTYETVAQRKEREKAEGAEREAEAREKASILSSSDLESALGERETDYLVFQRLNTRRHIGNLTMTEARVTLGLIDSELARLEKVKRGLIELKGMVKL